MYVVGADNAARRPAVGAAREEGRTETRRRKGGEEPRRRCQAAITRVPVPASRAPAGHLCMLMQCHPTKRDTQF